MFSKLEKGVLYHVSNEDVKLKCILTLVTYLMLVININYVDMISKIQHMLLYVLQVNLQPHTHTHTQTHIYTHTHTHTDTLNHAQVLCHISQAVTL